MFTAQTLLGAERFGLLNALVVVHFLYDTVAGFIHPTQKQLLTSFLKFLSHC